MDNTLFDIAIVGSGPQGLYASYKLKNKYNIICLEKDNNISNNILSYPNIKWHHTMGPLKLPGTLNLDIDDEYTGDSKFISSYYKKFNDEHNLNFITNKEVIDIVKFKNNYKLIIKDKTSYLCKIVILCTGIYNNFNKLDINTKYDFCVYKLNNFNIRNKKLIIVGGGASSTDYVVNLLPNNNTIYWIIRGNKYFELSDRHRRHTNFDSILSKYKNKLNIYYNSCITYINSDKSILLNNNIKIDNVDYCILLLGYHSKSKLIENTNIECEDNKYIKLNNNYETSKKNIYCAGSICTQKDHKVYIDNGNDYILSKILIDIDNKLKS